MSSRRAFTLVEILVVVTLVVVLALIGAINVLRARMTGNEGVALANLRQLAVALMSYQAVNNQFPDTLGLLSDATPPYLPASLTGGSGANGNSNVNGYAYDYTRMDAFHYTLFARPTSQGATGVRRFLVNEAGMLRYTTDGTDPTANSPLVQ